MSGLAYAIAILVLLSAPWWLYLLLGVLLAADIAISIALSD